MSLLLAIQPPWNGIQNDLQIRRQIGDELHAAAVAWMREREPRGVEKRPLQVRNRADIAGHAAMHAAIERIADHRMADGAQVNANLMRPAGVYRDLAERQIRVHLRDRKSTRLNSSHG